MADLRKLKDKAAEHYAKGRFTKAAEVLAQVIKADRRDIASHQKLGDALRKGGQEREALRVYQDVAGRYAQDGQLIKAVAICKIILEIDPQHAKTQDMLAELYAKKGGVGVSIPGLRPAAEEPPAEPEETGVELPLPKPRPKPPAASDDPFAPAGADPFAPAAGELELSFEVEGGDGPALAAAARGTDLSSAATPFEAILGVARQGAGEEEVLLLTDPTFDEPLETLVAPEPEPVAEAPEPAAEPVSPEAQAAQAAARLPHIPLFSDLGPEAFVALAERIALHRVERGAVIIREGEAGASFFVLASGAVHVEKAGADGAPVMLARLGEGSFFGEMAILSGEPRAATVATDAACDLLEIRAEALLDLAREHPQVVESLAKFYRRRLLANAMATSPIFRPFTREDRAAVMGRFRTREVAPGTAVTTEGEASDGLYVVLSGELDVWKRREGMPALAAKLHAGDVFGEMSCLRKGPASATVVATRRCVLLRLPRTAFDELVVTYPQILEMVSDLTDDRQRRLQAISSGPGGAADDGGPLLV